MDPEQRIRLKALIAQLEAIRGRHTELVSVYIPAGFQIAKVAEQLRNEQSTAANIKSKTVRKNVLAALEKILQHLKLYRETPAHGLAVFSGNTTGEEGAADVDLWAVEPPEPVKVRLYWCGQNFILDHLKEMVREKEVYGLLLVDKGDAEIGLLVGKRIEPLKYLESIVPGKTTAGGWSQHRYERVREGLLNDFLKKVGEIASKAFQEQKDLIGVLVAGPGPVKEEFIAGSYLASDIQKKVIGVVSTSYTGEAGLREMVNRAEDLLAQASVTKERLLLDKFFTALAKDTGLAAYGIREVKKALEMGAVDTLLLSEDFAWTVGRLKCSVGHESEFMVRRSQKPACKECQNPVTVLEQHDLAEALVVLAGQMGTSVEYVSVDTPGGIQFKELGGVAGLLRYKIA